MKKLNQSPKKARNYVILTAVLGTLLSASPLLFEPGLTSVPGIGAYLNGTFEPSNSPAGEWEWETTKTIPQLEESITAKPIPGTTKLAFGTIAGKIYSYDFGQNNPSPILMGDIAPGYDFSGNRYGLKGMAFHPDYGKVGSPNREYIYVSYFSNDFKRKLSRFNIRTNTGLLDVSTEQVLIEMIGPNDTFHTIGELEFGVDGFLYVPLGDGAGGPAGPYRNTAIARDIMNSVQKIDDNLVGGIMRIDVDQDPSKSHPPRKRLPQAFPDEISGVGYFIPNDNPWTAVNGTIMEEYYSIGHRNPWKLTKDPLTGDLWNGEVGPSNGEEINLIQKGRNYGWPYRVGATGDIVWDRQPPSDPEPNPYIGTLKEPVFSPSRADANAIFASTVYRGNKWPELYGKVLASTLSTRIVWAIDHNQTNNQTSTTVLPRLPTSSWLIFQDSNEDIYTLGLNGTLHLLTKTGTAPGTGDINFPQLLSQTNAFEDLQSLTTIGGLIPYDVNTPLWSDRSAKKRWIAIPNDGTFNTAQEKIKFSSENSWEFPEGTVFIKHFEMPIDDRNPNITKPIETRFSIVTRNGSLKMATYAWLDNGTDARLLLTGGDKDFTITGTSGQTRTQKWSYPTQNDCFTCHNSNAGQSLGVTTQQLNRDYLYTSTGISDNQLNTWSSLNIFDQQVADTAVLPQNVPLDHPTASDELKVRSYLDANCAYCHRPQGVAAAFDGRITTPFANQGLLNTNVVSSVSQNTFIVNPGDASTSELYARDVATDATKMPPLGRNLVDEEYVVLLKKWIDGLDSNSNPNPNPTPAQACSSDAYEGFDYATGTNLENVSGGEGFSTNWDIVGSANNISITSGSLTATGATTNGNKLRYNLTNGRTANIKRNFAERRFLRDTAWTSVLIKINNRQPGALYIRPNGRLDVAIGKLNGNTFGINQTSGSGIVPENGRTYRLVSRLTNAGGLAKVDLWINPTSANFNSSQPWLSKTSDRNFVSLKTLVIKAENGTGDYEIDEIYFGCNPPNDLVSSNNNNDPCGANGGDSDGDGICNNNDNCPDTANTDQADSDNDGIGDVCDTTNNLDSDNDGILNADDNCPNTANTNQADADNDGIGDVCDTNNNTDSDNDGILDADDNCPNAANANQADADNDGIGDVCDTNNNLDSDNDGILDADDNCPDTANTNQADTDNDGIGDVCDSTPNGANSNAKATLYFHCNYRGKSIEVGVGEYNNIRRLLTFPVNVLSSVRVPQGLEVVLYSEFNFEGTSIVLTADNNCLNDNDFDNKTKSVIVRQSFASLVARFERNTFSITVAPNPVAIAVDILLSTNENEQFNYFIKSVTGQTVKQGKLTSTNGLIRDLNVSAISEGVYFLLLVKEDGTTAIESLIISRN